MNDNVREALAKDRVIDITTTGRKSGQPRRIEIWFHNLDGAMYISGIPGKRSWYANLVARPSFTFHLKDSTQADLPARAHPVTDPEERRAVLSRILERLSRQQELESWVASSPLVAVTFDEP